MFKGIFADLRGIIGLFFLLVGLLLVLLGILKPHWRAPLTHVNVNLWVGLVLLLFGGVMLWLALRPTRS